MILILNIENAIFLNNIHVFNKRKLNLYSLNETNLAQC